MARTSARVVRAIRRRVTSPSDGAGRGSSKGDLIAIDTGAAIATIAMRLDIGAADLIAGERQAFDLPVGSLPSLFRSVVAACGARRQSCFVQVPGRIVPLAPVADRDPARLLGGRTDFRLFVVDADGELAENLHIVLWRDAGHSWVAMSEGAPLGRLRKTAVNALAAPPRPVTIDADGGFPIDVVYGWVNGSDPGWRASMARFRDIATLNADHFEQSDELRYSLRSLDLFAPWIRRIHVFSDCSPPAWFRASDRVRWVDHRDVIEESALPLFNSAAIETYFPRIPDLAEHFLYLNDDFILWDGARPSTFFTVDGKSIAHLNPRGLVVYWQQLLDAGEADTYQSACANGARLINERFGHLPARSHQHVPYAFRKSAVERMEGDFPDAFRQLRGSRFRDLADAQLMCFVYHHWAIATGVGVADTARVLMVDTRGAAPFEDPQLDTVDFLCLNDTGGSAVDPKMRQMKEAFFGTRLPIRSSAESPAL